MGKKYKKYKKYKRNNHKKDNLDTIKRFLQWAYYQGGIGMLFVIFGIVLILIFSLGVVIFNWNQIIILILGFLSIGLGFYLIRDDQSKGN